MACTAPATENIDLTIDMNSINDYSLYWNSTLNYTYRVFWSVDLSDWTAFIPDVTGSD